MDQSMATRGKLGFVEDQVKLAIMAFQENDDAVYTAAIQHAMNALVELQTAHANKK